MEIRDGLTDAETARDRSLAAIVGADFETGLALWRAALRYQERVRLERAKPRLESSPTRSTRYQGDASAICEL